MRIGGAASGFLILSCSNKREYLLKPLIAILNPDFSILVSYCSGEAEDEFIPKKD